VNIIYIHMYQFCSHLPILFASSLLHFTTVHSFIPNTNINYSNDHYKQYEHHKTTKSYLLLSLLIFNLFIIYLFSFTLSIDIIIIIATEEEEGGQCQQIHKQNKNYTHIPIKSNQIQSNPIQINRNYPN